jgi:hypothetical protein
MTRMGEYFFQSVTPRKPNPSDWSEVHTGRAVGQAVSAGVKWRIVIG